MKLWEFPTLSFADQVLTRNTHESRGTIGRALYPTQTAAGINDARMFERRACQRSDLRQDLGMVL